MRREFSAGAQERVRPIGTSGKFKTPERVTWVQSVGTPDRVLTPHSVVIPILKCILENRFKFATVQLLNVAGHPEKDNMSANLTAEFILGPIALLANLAEHGGYPSTTAQLAEFIASALGTMLYFTAAGTAGTALTGGR